MLHSTITAALCQIFCLCVTDRTSPCVLCCFVFPVAWLVSVLTQENCALWFCVLLADVQIPPSTCVMVVEQHQRSREPELAASCRQTSQALVSIFCCSQSVLEEPAPRCWDSGRGPESHMVSCVVIDTVHCCADLP